MTYYDREKMLLEAREAANLAIEAVLGPESEIEELMLAKVDSQLSLILVSSQHVLSSKQN